MVSRGYEGPFDEYFGSVDEHNRPSGMGVMFYNDESIYFGDWLEGQHHSTGKAMYIRPGGNDC